ncbi:MAG: ABC transporter ATP-binding protein [Desulfobacterales bacterium]|nr:ABC transporter ATP-binding protein [Desulfobacterales bacterium]
MIEKYFLNVEGLFKSFGKNLVVHDIDLKLEQGEIRGLIGPNGAGKTTLFNLISGFLTPNKGKIVWQGKNITGSAPSTIVKNGIARTFQLDVLLKDMTVLQNVLIGHHLHVNIGVIAQLLGLGKVKEKEKEAMRMSLELLEFMGLLELKNEIAGELPHGHQRSLGIAIALATEPKLLMLDEPITGMNSVEALNTMKKIKCLREKGITILIVEHNMRAVMSTCDKLTVINFGQKIAEGPPENVCENSLVIEAYLGSPDDEDDLILC